MHTGAMDARRDDARPPRRPALASGRALALLGTLLVAFQAAEEEEIFRYDEPKAVIEGLEVRAPDAGRLERLEESLGAKFEYQPIPDDMAEKAAKYRSELIELVHGDSAQRLRVVPEHGDGRVDGLPSLAWRA